MYDLFCSSFMKEESPKITVTDENEEFYETKHTVKLGS